MPYDVVIVGAGPGGLAAALTLGRGRKRVLVCDSGPRRNAAAEHMHNFVTCDGTPPEEFRRVARDQLAAYPNVEVRDERVAAISGDKGKFQVRVGSESVESRRILLATGMIDELPALEGLRDLWGRVVFQCPYCHGWEVRDRRWGYLAHAASARQVPQFALLARGWTRDLVVFTSGSFELESDARAQLERAGIRIETRPISRLIARGRELEGVELSNGSVVPCDVIATHPEQHQVELVRSLGVALDDDGYVRVDPMTNETSIAGIYAAGDLTTRMQTAIFSAAAGTRAAASINLELTTELALRGLL